MSDNKKMMELVETSVEKEENSEVKKSYQKIPSGII